MNSKEHPLIDLTVYKKLRALTTKSSTIGLMPITRCENIGMTTRLSSFSEPGSRCQIQQQLMQTRSSVFRTRYRLCCWLLLPRPLLGKREDWSTYSLSLLRKARRTWACRERAKLRPCLDGTSRSLALSRLIWIIVRSVEVLMPRNNFYSTSAVYLTKPGNGLSNPDRILVCYQVVG
jgi:hypothetical protein